MEWGFVNDALAREHQRPGCCIACDNPLPIKPAGAKGRPRTLLCGDAECLRAYHAMRKSMQRELEAMGRRTEAEQATALLKASAAAIRRANWRLQKVRQEQRREAAHATS
jgi:hypothetical protein